MEAALEQNASQEESQEVYTTAWTNMVLDIGTLQDFSLCQVAGADLEHCQHLCNDNQCPSLTPILGDEDQWLSFLDRQLLSSVIGHNSFISGLILGASTRNLVPFSPC